jgi:peroxiredoxin
MKIPTLAAFAMALCACGSSQPGTTPAASPTESGGSVAPDFTGRDVTGKTFRLSDTHGKVVLLDFWATFCEPCKAEFPHLRALYESDRDKGFLVVGVAMDGPETVADVPSFVKRFDLGFPVVTDEDSRIASLYNPKKSMPLSVLIDRAGHVVTVREGYNPGEEKLVAADVDKALAAAAP